MKSIASIASIVRWGGHIVIGGLFTGLFSSGCSQQPLTPPIRSGEPVGVQLMRKEPAFGEMPFRVLLDFESANDLAFIAEPAGMKATVEGALRVDSQVAHTGAHSLQIPGGRPREIQIKLTSMLPSDFPGSWTLLGGYFIALENTTVRICYQVSSKIVLQRTVALAARKWTPVMLDLSSLSDPNTTAGGPAGVLTFTTDGPAVWCDDIMAIDNGKVLVADSQQAGDQWTVRRRGFSTLIDRPGAFKLNVPTPEASAEGWRLVEANEMRIRMVDAGGKKTWTLYSDGRGYLDGKFKPLIDFPADQAAMFVEQQESPAGIAVPGEMGRVERNTPGDRHNDGYSETSGAYQLKAFGPRLDITLTPRTAKLTHPVVEVVGLPAGRVLATVEGKLVERIVRLPNGTVLAEIPTTLNRAVTINLRIP
jgi:hypothetical protein